MGKSLPKEEESPDKKSYKRLVSRTKRLQKLVQTQAQLLQEYRDILVNCCMKHHLQDSQLLQQHQDLRETSEIQLHRNRNSNEKETKILVDTRSRAESVHTNLQPEEIDPTFFQDQPLEYRQSIDKSLDSTASNELIDASDEEMSPGVCTSPKFTTSDRQRDPGNNSGKSDDISSAMLDRKPHKRKIPTERLPAFQPKPRKSNDFLYERTTKPIRRPAPKPPLAKVPKSSVSKELTEDEPKYQYVEVVRKKKEREELPGHECAECAAYYAALDVSISAAEQMQHCSRHRSRFAPYNTPDNFWDLNFPDSAPYERQESD